MMKYININNTNCKCERRTTMKNKRAKILVLIGTIIVIIVISFAVISSNNSFNNSLNVLKNEGDIDYILQDILKKIGE